MPGSLAGSLLLQGILPATVMPDAYLPNPTRPKLCMLQRLIPGLWEQGRLGSGVGSPGGHWGLVQATAAAGELLFSTMPAAVLRRGRHTERVGLFEPALAPACPALTFCICRPLCSVGSCCDLQALTGPQTIHASMEPWCIFSHCKQPTLPARHVSTTACTGCPVNKPCGLRHPALHTARPVSDNRTLQAARRLMRTPSVASGT